jgi:hypothetical protein
VLQLGLDAVAAAVDGHGLPGGDVAHPTATLG